MSRSLVSAVAVATALLLSAGAQAKAPLSGIDICGVTGCVRLGGSDGQSFFLRSHENAPAPAPARFYVIHWRWTADSPEQSAYWIPARASARWDYGDQGVAWGSVEAPTNKRIRQLVASIEPFALPTPTRVTIGGRDVRAPETYLRLFRGRQVYSWPAIRWLQIRIEDEQQSPWTDGRSKLMLAQNKPYVIVDHWVYRISKKMSAQAHRLVPLRG
jgi:hypothetical protein